MSYLGIDIGSSCVKAVAFQADGKRLAMARRGYEFLSPTPGAMELDSAQVLTAACEVIAQVAAQTVVDPIRALAISSQGEAITPVDRVGRPLANAMISGDSRATDAMMRFTEKFSAQKLYRITGHTPSAMFSLAKLLWLAEQRPQVRRRAAQFLCFEDLLLAKLGMPPHIGWPLAARTMLFDLHTHDWSPEILNAAGFSADEFARPAPPGSIVGTVSAAVAAELGLPKKVLVVAGGHDQTVAALGCGVQQPGTAMYAAGSVECIVPVSERPRLSETLRRHNLCCYDHAMTGRYASVAYCLTGSNFLQYFLQYFARELGDDYSALINSMPDAPTGLLVEPYFTPSGTPFFDVKTPGVVYGWRLTTSRGELLKGIEEGIVFEMKLNLELLRRSGFAIERLIASGGGCRHPAMVQLRSDILGLPIAVSEEPETGCRGAALLAQSADCDCAPNDLPEAMPNLNAEHVPDLAKQTFYQEKFVEWLNFTRKIKRIIP